MYNAMSYKDVKQFAFQLLDDLSQKFNGKPFEGVGHKGAKRGEYDDDEVAVMVAKMLAS